ncbi:MAG: ABC transporter permease subunit [Deltaproteobacteria bacterium]|nr:ABC transporter permease subunit [Deltaproteobacteria bacterium]
MLRHAVRRLLWVAPSLLGVSLLTFFVLARVGERASPLSPGPGEHAQERARRAAFLDLPLFVNTAPRDVRARAAEAVLEMGAGGARTERGRRELVRLGGAALPFVLPRLDTLAPPERAALALALAPVAGRMGLAAPAAPQDGAAAVLFWSRFWETRSAELREATARSAVERFARYGTEARADEVRVLDTLALDALFESLEEPGDRSSLGRTRRLVDLIAHATGQQDRIGPDADLDRASACVRRWQRWWLVYRSDFVPLLGAARVGAIFLQTRYGKWVHEAVVMRLGLDAQGRPVLHDLGARAAVTMALVLAAIALAYALAVPLGALGAAWRGRAWGHGLSAAALLPHVLSPAVLGVLAGTLGARSHGSIVVPSLVLALVLVADPTRHARTALVRELCEDHVRAVVARGAGPKRVLVVHALPAALVPVTCRLALELPFAVTGAFVLERVFGLSGLGEATTRAVQDHDTRWLMALALGFALVAALALVAADVAQAALDPRAASRARGKGT